MKITNLFAIGLCVLFVFSISAFAQQETTPKKNPKYDKELAEKLGADKYGMKQYVFVSLKRGTKKFEEKERAALLQGHMEFIGRMAKEGKLVLAGPFGDDKDIRGIYIFDLRTVADARKLVESDPSIKAGLFEVELRPWYGSAALMEVLTIHEKIAEEEL